MRFWFCLTIICVCLVFVVAGVWMELYERRNGMTGGGFSGLTDLVPGKGKKQ